MKEGAVADWLYIIYKGGVEVRLYSERKSGPYRAVKILRNARAICRREDEAAPFFCQDRCNVQPGRPIVEIDVDQ